MPGLLDGSITTAPTRVKRPGGKTHRLAYVNADEAALLRARGGGVTPGGGQLTWGGVPSFEGEGDGGAGGQGSGSAGGGSDASMHGDIIAARGDNPAAALPPLPPEIPRPSIDLNPTPVYTQQPAVTQAPVTGTTPLGIAQALQAMRSMFGPRPLPGGPPGGSQAAPAYAGGGIPSQVPGGNNRWTPPVIAPNAPQQPILTGYGGNTDYYAALQRLAPQQAGGVSWGDPTHRMW